MSNKKRKNGQQRPQQQGGTQMSQPQQTQSPIGRKLKTPTGFEYELKAKNLTDMRFLDNLVTMQDPNRNENERTVATVRVIQLLLGDEQKEAFYAHVVKIYGYADPAGTGKELGYILANFDQGKKK